MNTSFHFRAHTSNLLSKEFLEMVRPSLKQGGIFYYNTTSSKEALRTAAMTYPYALRVLNFVAVSDGPMKLDKQRWRKLLTQYKIDGLPVLGITPKILALGNTLESRDSLLRTTEDARLLLMTIWGRSGEIES